jgi:hypothetical protein
VGNQDTICPLRASLARWKAHSGAYEERDLQQSTAFHSIVTPFGIDVPIPVTVFQVLLYRRTNLILVFLPLLVSPKTQLEERGFQDIDVRPTTTKLTITSPIFVDMTMSKPLSPIAHQSRRPRALASLEKTDCLACFQLLLEKPSECCSPAELLLSRPGSSVSIGTFLSHNQIY